MVTVARTRFAGLLAAHSPATTFRPVRPPEGSAAVLRELLEYRGHTGPDLITDAYQH